MMQRSTEFKFFGIIAYAFLLIGYQIVCRDIVKFYNEKYRTDYRITNAILPLKYLIAHALMRRELDDDEIASQLSSIYLQIFSPRTDRTSNNQSKKLIPPKKSPALLVLPSGQSPGACRHPPPRKTSLPSPAFCKARRWSISPTRSRRSLPCGLASGRRSSRPRSIRIPRGAFVALRTDMHKDFDKNPEKFKRAPFPAWAFETIKFLYEQRGVTATGHESLDTDITDKMESETYILSKGHYQIEVMANLLKHGAACVGIAGVVVPGLVDKQRGGGCGGTGRLVGR